MYGGLKESNLTVERANGIKEKNQKFRGRGRKQQGEDKQIIGKIEEGWIRVGEWQKKIWEIKRWIINMFVKVC